MDLTKENIEKLTRAGDRLFSARIEYIKRKGKPIMLFGAGEGGRNLQKLLEKRGITVSFFTDNRTSTWGSVIAGIPVLSPKDAIKVNPCYRVISASEVENISNQLRQLGVTEFEDQLYLMYVTSAYRQVFAGHLLELRKVRKLLREKASLKTFDSLVKHTFSLESSLLRPIVDRNQYFFSKRFSIRPEDVVIDAGSFTGDTIADIIRRFGKKFDTIHCFEPSKENHSLLKRFRDKNKLEKKVILHQAGLSDRCAVLHFSGLGLGYHETTADDPSGEKVPIVTIDSVFEGKRVDFIKMDIEGSEPKAIKGAKKVIRRDTPDLAICIYHYPEHFWEIPLQLAAMVPGYSFFLRHHSLGRLETVWYAAMNR